jgi:hypothetical protein
VFACPRCAVSIASLGKAEDFALLGRTSYFPLLLPRLAPISGERWGVSEDRAQARPSQRVGEPPSKLFKNKG